MPAESPPTRLALFTDPAFALHDTSNPHGVADRDPAFGHPERPDRLRAIHKALRLSGLLASPDPFPNFHIDLGPLPQTQTPALDLPFRTATDADLRLIHPQSHLDRVARHCAAGLPLDEDTPVCPSSDALARKAVGAVLTAVDTVLEKKADRQEKPHRAFVIARPPGHHAEPNRAMGFCLYATIAIAAQHALHRHHLPKVAIFDFDVHHGNGTQASLFPPTPERLGNLTHAVVEPRREAERFPPSPHLLFISTHQSPQTCYPGTGYPSENTPSIVNIPLTPGTGHAEYLSILQAQVLPALTAFGPDLLLLSAGFDAHTDDPLAQLNLTEDTYAQIARALCDTFPATPIVALLEGGYHLQALARSATRFALELQQ